MLDYTFNSITIGDGASGELDQTAGTITTTTLTINDGGIYNQTGTGVLNGGTITLGTGATLTLMNQGTGVIDGAAAGQGDLVFAGTYNTEAAIGATNSLNSITVNDGATLTLDQNANATTVTVGQGVSGILNQSAGTVTVRANQAMPS